MTTTTKQRVFIDEYLLDFNATRAAKAAGYSENTAAIIGHENLRKPNIAAEIQRRLDELTMSTNEALVRLTEQGRGAYTEYITSHGTVDILGLKNAGLGHLIKGVKENKYGKVVEFHDAQAAIDKILRVRGAYVERRELSGKDGGPLAVEHTHHLAEVSDDDLRRNLAAFGRAALAASGRAPIPDDSGGATGDDSESESQ